MNSDDATSSGVQELIERLHQEGLAKGQEQADEIVSEARSKADKIIGQAQHEAEEIAAAAMLEAERTRIAGEEAVRLAGRDAILRLTEELRDDFVRKLRELVGSCLQDTEFLKQLILEIAGKSLPKRADSPLNIELLLNKELAESKRGSSQDEAINTFIRELGGEALRDGLRLGFAHSEVPGVRIQAMDEDLEIELNSETITHLLIKHLSPRFRAIVEQE